MNDDDELDWEKDGAVDDWLSDVKPETNAKETPCLMQPMKVKFTA